MPRVLVVLLVGTLLHFGPSNRYSRLSAFFARLPWPARALVLTIAIVIKDVADFEAQPFLYFQF